MRRLSALPASLPLPEAKAALLPPLLDGLSAASLWWLSGYVAGLAEVQGSVVLPPAPAAEVASAARLTVVYGSQTGNSKRLAERLVQQLQNEGLATRLLRADAYPLRELKEERYLALVISTQGDGDPPDDARAFVEYVLGTRAPKLPQLQFAVLGLGDSSYPQFCAIGRRLDARLAELGGQRWHPRADADLDIDAVATPWLETTLGAAREALKPASAPLATVTPLRPLPPAPSAHGRDRPYGAEVLLNQRITGRGSRKDVRHVELALEGSGLNYEPGDALGLWPENPPALVQAVLDSQRLDGEALVTHGGSERPLRDWLLRHRELTRLARPFVAAHAERAGDAELLSLLAPEHATALTQLLSEQQPIDLLQRAPARWSAPDLIAGLRPLTPRLYSIASSQKAFGEEAHLTVAHVEYAHAGETRWGAASHQLASTAAGARLPVYIEANERFRLPRDGSRDVIMIGPGSGVAPFRGFVQERATIGASGRNWLLFGNGHARSEFLYQTEWQQALKRGQLHRLDLAFSRDVLRSVSDATAAVPTKTYVQHRLREHGREVYAWLDGGAHLYVCGAIAMAKSVHATLLALIAEHNGRSPEQAEEYLSALQAQGRYARDVY